MFCSRRHRNRGNESRSRHDHQSALDPDQVERVIGFARDHLRIAPDQFEAWGNFVDAVRTGAEEVHSARTATPLSGDIPVAPARLAHMETVAAAGAEALRRVRPAFEGLYAALDREQRSVLERLTGRDGFAYR